MKFRRSMAAWALCLLAFATQQLLLYPHPVTAGTTAPVQISLFKPMIVLVGDSITEFGFVDDGWGLQLADAYNRKADVVNRGFGGYTTRMGVYVLDEFLNSFGAGRIKLVTLCFGANDALSPDGIGGYLHVPLDEYKANLVAMVKKLKSKGITNVVIMTPPPVMQKLVKRKDGSSALGGPSPAAMKAYAAGAIAVANQEGVPYLDLYNAIQKIKNWQVVALEKDGRHLTPHAQKVVFSSLMTVINRSIKEISPWNMPVHMPDYRYVNSQEPGVTFNTLYGYRVKTGVELPPPAPAPAAAAEAAAATTAAAAAAKAAVRRGQRGPVPAVAAKAASTPAPAAPAPTPAAAKAAPAAAPAAAATAAAKSAPAVTAKAAPAAVAAKATPAAAPKAVTEAAAAPTSAKPAAQRRPMRQTGQ